MRRAVRLRIQSSNKVRAHHGDHAAAYDRPSLSHPVVFRQPTSATPPTRQNPMHDEMAAPGTRLIREDRHPRPWSNKNNAATMGLTATGFRAGSAGKQKTMQKMKAIKRRVIYFTRDPSPDLLASFEERDWEVEVIGSVRDVRQAVDD